MRTILQQKWLAQYHELIDYEKLNTSDSNMPGKLLKNWVITQRRHYRLFQEGKNNTMTAERIELLEEIGFTWSVMNQEKWLAQYNEPIEYEKLNRSAAFTVCGGKKNRISRYSILALSTRNCFRNMI